MIMKWKLSISNYRVATLFIDHASWFFCLSLHSSTGAQEGIDAKNKFERAAKEHGITIKKYHANNKSTRANYLDLPVTPMIKT